MLARLNRLVLEGRFENTARVEVDCENNPKHALFMGLYLVIGECVIHSHHSKAKKAINETSERTMKSLFPSKGSYESEFLARCKEILRSEVADAEPTTKITRRTRSSRH